MRRWFSPLLLLAVVLLLAGASGPVAASDNEAADDVLAPNWPPAIRQWSTHIAALSEAYGLDPDFIAAVIRAESVGDENGVSYAGAVGLMGVMPAEAGFVNRPSSETLLKPGSNLRWGVTILSEIIRQSGGDVAAALAAYNGGWELVDARGPRAYAAGVLNYYGQAVAARSGLAPEVATRWTIAFEIHGGNIPTEALLFHDKPISGLRMYGEHVVYQHVTRDGRSYYVKGYAVPLALTVPGDFDELAPASPSVVEEELLTRLDMETLEKGPGGNRRILLACLPVLTRLRGRVNTRWFAPSACPSWQR